jgi:hypothetical protein
MAGGGDRLQERRRREKREREERMKKLASFQV